MSVDRKRYMSRVTYRTAAVGEVTVDYAVDSNAELDVIIEAAVMDMGEGYRAVIAIVTLPGIEYTDTIESLTKILGNVTKPCKTDEPS